MIRSTDKTPRIDVLGPVIRFLSPVESEADDFVLIEGTMAPGVFVPLHSHPDHEIFTIVAGSLDVYIDGQWHTVQVGDSVDAQANVPHAWRNTSNSPVRLFVLITAKIGRFFTEIGKPASDVSGPPSVGEIEKLLRVSARYGYWNASPEENAAIGLTLPVG